LKHSLFILAHLFCIALFSQPTDSELTALLKRKSLAEQSKILDSLAVKFRTTSIQQATSYSLKACELAKEAEENELLGINLISLGKCYRQTGNYDKAIEVFKKSLVLLQEVKSVLSSEAALQIGTAYYYKGSYNAAIENYFVALAISEKFNNKEGEGRTLANIGNIYYVTSKLDSALMYYEKSYSIYQSMNDSLHTALIIDNMANVYGAKGENEKSLKYHRKALAIFEKTDKGAYCEGLNTMGSFFAETKNYDSAAFYFHKSLVFAQEINDNFTVAVSNLNLADLMLLTQKYKEALYFAEKSLNISKANGISAIMKETYKKLYEINLKLGKSKEAYVYYKSFSELKDSLLTEENLRQMDEISLKYDTDKKDSEIDLLLKDKGKKQLLIYVFTGGVFLMLVFGVIIFTSNKKKKKSNRLLSEQNQIIIHKNKDITDSISYAKRIQEAMLPSDQVFENAFSEWFIIYRPKDIVSGDFYWSFKRGDDVFIAVADCTGHGVPGALMSLVGINFYNQTIIGQKISETHSVLNELHKKNLTSLNSDMKNRDSKDGMDTALIKLSSKSNQLQFSGAVRPLYYFQKGELKIIKGERYSIGGVKDLKTSFLSQSVQLERNDSVYLFSDGYADQFGGPHTKKFMVKRFQELLVSIHSKTLQEQKLIIEQEFDKWKGDNEQVDDVLVIGFKI